MHRLHRMLLDTVCLDRAELRGVVCNGTWPLTVVSCQYSPIHLATSHSCFAARTRLGTTDGELLRVVDTVAASGGDVQRLGSRRGRPAAA
jgi:hypothetical protein